MSTKARHGVVARIAVGSARRPWIALAAWVVIVGFSAATALFGITGDTLFGRLVSGAPTATSESSRADDQLNGGETNTESTTLAIYGVRLTDPAVIAIGPQLTERLAGITGAKVVDPLAVPLLPNGDRVPAIAALIAESGDGVLYPVTVPDTDTSIRDSAVSIMETLRDELRAQFPGATVEIGNTRILVDSIVKVSENDLARGESVALPIALVVMLVVFGGFIAAGIPLVGAIASIVGALGALFGISYLMDIDTTVINVITAVGLGLSIDYGLLIVSRFREEYRAALGDGLGDGSVGHGERRMLRLDAIASTAASAGRTVLYSGTTFALVSLGLLVFQPRLVRAIGVGALCVTVIAIASALTLVPALLALSGERLIGPGALTKIPGVGRVITRFGDVAPDEGVFSRLTRRVQRHPALVTLACTLALLALATPALSLRLANTSVDALPAASTQKTFVVTIRDHFPDAAAPRVLLVTDTKADATSWAAQVKSLPNVTSVGIPFESGNGWGTAVRVTTGYGMDVVRDIRSDRPDFPASVTGTDARTVDFTQSLLDRSPWAILIISLATIAMLFLMTGSLVVPLKALAASALSLGASIGVLVWGFQWGNFAQVMGFDASEVHGVDPLVIVLVLVFGFGLAMDYEMFILSRITELVESGADGRDAIARGLQRSGRIITSAALIIVVVFAGFATGDLLVIKQLGVALAVAVTLDATLVRLLLVPAFMTWQLRIMWWAPRWMKRVHARFALRD
jgi:RND superfamily putative drug exporter